MTLAVGKNDTYQWHLLLGKSLISVMAVLLGKSLISVIDQCHLHYSKSISALAQHQVPLIIAIWP